MRQGFELAGNAVVTLVGSVVGNKLETFYLPLSKRSDAYLADIT